MDWAEALFEKAERWLQERNQIKKGLVPSSDCARLPDLKNLISCWAVLISGRSWTIQESESWAAVDGERLFLPPVLDIFSTADLNRRAYLYVTCFLLGHDEVKLPELGKWRALFQADQRRQDGEELGPRGLLYQVEPIPAQAEIPVWEGGSFRSLMNLWTVRKIQAQINSRKDADADANRKQAAKKTHSKKAREQVQILDEMKDPEADNPLVHSFEKLHTTDDYKGGQKNQDGEDDLADQGDSLDELDMKQVIRSSQETKAALKGDFVMDVDVAESLSLESSPETAVFLYDEWDEAKSLYHPQWCRLEERTPQVLQDEQAVFSPEKVRRQRRGQIEVLTRSLHSLFQSPKWKTRQSDGSELDLDALVSLMATPAEVRPEKMNVYMNRRKSINELSVVLLFDRSLSSDSWIDNRRVLDITRESLVVIGESLKKFPLDVQLASFCSQTRNKIHYDILKDFNESWGLGLQRLGSIEPSGYTRIGPALRHASRQLECKKAKHKWILLLSDAKPTDFDKYEGRYGVRDVRKAIFEAKSHQIGVRCLSIESQNRLELAEMFGPRGYELLERVDDLPTRLGLLLKNLIQLAR